MSDKKLTLNPLKDCLVVRSLKKEEVTKSGIILPETVHAPVDRVAVVKCGKNEFDLNLEEGDVLLLSGLLKNIGVPVSVDQQELFLIKIKDVAALESSKSYSL